MKQNLRDFIAAREAEVKAQIQALNAELRELRAAKSAIEGGNAAGADRTSSNRMTHREMIVSALDKRPDGGTSDKVIEWVSSDFDVNISQASISSQLSRAKSDGDVTLEPRTKIWRSAKHSDKKNEPPEGDSEAEEVTASSDMQTKTEEGIPSDNNPDPEGQTRHWKMPGV